MLGKWNPIIGNDCTEDFAAEEINEIVIEKHKYNGFDGTGLADILRKRNIEVKMK